MQNNLKKYRNKEGLSQESAAKKLYVTRQTISRWENSHNMPPVLALEDLAKLYNTSVANLIGQEPDSKKKKLNLFALIGVIISNVFLGLLLILFLGTFLFAVSLIGIMFFLSPFILSYLNLFHIQAFSWKQTGYSIGLFVISLPIILILWYIYKFIYKFLRSYIRYNIESLFH